MGKLRLQIFLATLLSGVASQMTSGDSAPSSTVNYDFTVPEGSENTRYTSGSGNIQGNESKALPNLEGQPNAFENNQSPPTQPTRFTSNPGEVIRYSSVPDSQDEEVKQQIVQLSKFSDPALQVQAASSRAVQPPNIQQDAQQETYNHPSGKGDLSETNHSLFHSAYSSGRNTQYSSKEQPPLYKERTSLDHEATKRLNVDNAHSPISNADTENLQLEEPSSIKLPDNSRDHPSLLVSRPSKPQISDLGILDSTPEPQILSDNSNPVTPASISSIASSTVRSVTDSLQLTQDKASDKSSQQKLHDKTNKTVDGNDPYVDNQNKTNEPEATESSESEEQPNLLKYYPAALKSAGERSMSKSSITGADSSEKMTVTSKSNPLITLNKSNSTKPSDEDTSLSKSSVPKIGEHNLPINESNRNSELLPTTSSPEYEQVETFVTKMDGSRGLEFPSPFLPVSSIDNPGNINTPPQHQQLYPINNLPLQISAEQNPISDILNNIKSSLNPLSSSLNFYFLEQNPQTLQIDGKPNPDYFIKIIPDRNNPQLPGLQLIGETLNPGFFEIQGTFGLWPSLIPLLFGDKPITISSTNGRLQSSAPSLQNPPPNLPGSNKLQVPITIRFMIPPGMRFGGRIKYPSDYPVSDQSFSSYLNPLSSLSQSDNKQDPNLDNIIIPNIDILPGSPPPKSFDPRNLINYATTTYVPSNPMPLDPFSLRNSTFSDFRSLSGMPMSQIGKFENSYYGTNNYGYPNFEYPRYLPFDSTSLMGSPRKKITQPSSDPFDTYGTLDITGDGSPKYKNPTLRYPEVHTTKKPLIYTTTDYIPVSRIAPSSQTLPKDKITETSTLPFDPTKIFGITVDRSPDFREPNPRYPTNNYPEEQSISEIPNGIPRRDLSIQGSDTVPGWKIPGYPNSPSYNTETIHTTVDGSQDFRKPNPRYPKINNPEQMSQILNGIPQRDLSMQGSYTLPERKIPGYSNSPSYTPETMDSAVDGKPDFGITNPKYSKNNNHEEQSMSKITKGISQRDPSIHDLYTLSGWKIPGYPNSPLDTTETIHTTENGNPDFRNPNVRYPEINNPEELSMPHISNVIPQRDRGMPGSITLPGRKIPGYLNSPLDTTETIHTTVVDGSPDFREPNPRYLKNDNPGQQSIPQIPNAISQRDLSMQGSYTLPGWNIPGYPNSPLYTTVAGSPDFIHSNPRYPKTNYPEELSMSQILNGIPQRDPKMQGSYTLPGWKIPGYPNSPSYTTETIHTTVDGSQDFIEPNPRYPKNNNPEEQSISQIPNAISQRDTSMKGSFTLPGRNIPGYRNLPLDTTETIHTSVDGSPDFKKLNQRYPKINNPEEQSIFQIRNGIPPRDLSIQESYTLPRKTVPGYPISSVYTTETVHSTIDGSPDIRNAIPRYPKNKNPGELSISQVSIGIPQRNLSIQGSYTLPGMTNTALPSDYPQRDFTEPDSSTLPGGEITRYPTSVADKSSTPDLTDASHNVRNPNLTNPKYVYPKQQSTYETLDGFPHQEPTMITSRNIPGTDIKKGDLPNFKNPIYEYSIYTNPKDFTDHSMTGKHARPETFDAVERPIFSNASPPEYINQNYTNQIDQNPNNPNYFTSKYAPTVNDPIPEKQEQFPNRDNNKPGYREISYNPITGSTTKPLDAVGRPDMPNYGLPNYLVSKYNSAENPRIYGSFFDIRDATKPDNRRFPESLLGRSTIKPIEIIGRPDISINGPPDNVNRMYANQDYGTRTPGNIPQQDSNSPNNITPNYLNPRYGIPRNHSGSGTLNDIPQQDLTKPGNPMDSERSKTTMSTKLINPTGLLDMPNEVDPDDENQKLTNPNDGNPRYPTLWNSKYGIPENPSGSVALRSYPQQDPARPGYLKTPESSRTMSTTKPLDAMGRLDIPEYVNEQYGNPNNPNYLNYRFDNPRNPSGSGILFSSPQQDFIEPGQHNIPEESITMSTTNSIDPTGRIDMPNNINPDGGNQKYTNPNYGNPRYPTMWNFRYGIPQNPSGTGAQDGYPHEDLSMPGYAMNPERSIKISTTIPIDPTGRLNIPNNINPDDANQKYTNPNYGNPRNSNYLDTRYNIPQNPYGSGTLESFSQHPIKFGRPINPETSITMKTAKSIDSTGRPPNNNNPDDVNGKYLNTKDPSNTNYSNPRYGFPQYPSSSGALDNIPQQDPSKPGYPMDFERSKKITTAKPVDGIAQRDMTNNINPEYVNGKFTNPDNPSNQNYMNPSYGIPQNSTDFGTLDIIRQREPIEPDYPMNPEGSVTMSTTNPINAIERPHKPGYLDQDYTNPNDGNLSNPNYLNPRYGISPNPPGSGTQDSTPPQHRYKPGYPKISEKSITMSTVKSIDPKGRLDIPEYVNQKYANSNYGNPSNQNYLNPRYGSFQNPYDPGTLESFPEYPIKFGYPINPETSIPMSTAKSIDPTGRLDIPNNMNPDDASGKYVNPQNPGDPNNLNPRDGFPQYHSSSGILESTPQQDPIKPGYPIINEKSITMSTAKSIDPTGRLDIPNNINPDDANGKYANPKYPGDPNYLNPRDGFPQYHSSSGTLDRILQQDPIEPGYPIITEKSITMSTAKSIDPMGRLDIPEYGNQKYANSNYGNPSNQNYLNPRYGISKNPNGSGTLESFPQYPTKFGHPINPETSIPMSTSKSIDLTGLLDIPDNMNPNDANGKYPKNPGDPNYLNHRDGFPQYQSSSGTLGSIPQQDPIKPSYPIIPEKSITMSTSKSIDPTGRRPEYGNQKYANPNYGNPSNQNYLNLRYGIPQYPDGSSTQYSFPQYPIKFDYPINPETPITMSTVKPIDNVELTIEGSPSKPIDGPGVPKIYLDSKRPDDSSIQEFPRSLSIERKFLVTPHMPFDTTPTTDTTNYGYPSNHKPLKGLPFNYYLGNPVDSLTRGGFSSSNIPSLISTWSSLPQQTVDISPQNPIDSTKPLLFSNNPRNPNYENEYLNVPDDRNKEGSATPQMILGKYNLPGLLKFLGRPISSSSTDEVDVSGEPEITTKGSLDSLHQSPSNADSRREQLSNPIYYDDMMRHLSALYPLNKMVGNHPVIQQLLQKWYPLGIPMEYRFGMQPDPVTGLLGKTNPPPLNSLSIYPFSGHRISHNGYPKTNPGTQQLTFGSTGKEPQEPSLIRPPDEDKDQMFWTPNEVGGNAPRQYNVNIQPRVDNRVYPDPLIPTVPSFKPFVQIRKANYLSPILNSLDPKLDAAKELSVLPNKTNQLNPTLFQDPTNLPIPKENQSSSLSSESEITEPNKSFEYETDNTSQRPSEEQQSAILDYSKVIEVPTSDSLKLIHQPEQNSRDRSQDTTQETSRVIRYYPASAQSDNTSDQTSGGEQPGQHNQTPSDQFPNYPTLAFDKSNRSKAISEPSSNEPTDTKLHESAGTKYYQQTVQRYDTPESAQYNPDYNQLGEGITLGSTPVRGYVDQTYETRTPGGSPDPIALSSSNENRPFDQRIVSLNPSSRFISERLFKDQKLSDPSYGNTPDSPAHITYYHTTMPESIPYPGLTANARLVSGSDKLPKPIENKIPGTPYLIEKYALSKSPTLLSNRKTDSSELNSGEQIDQDGIIRHYGQVQHTTKGYITYYPSNIQTNRIIGRGLPSDPRYVYTINNQAIPGGDSSLSTPRILSEPITKVHSWPIGGSSQVSTTGESSDNAPNLIISEGDQHPPSSALNSSTTRSLFSTKRFMNSVDPKSPNENSLPEDSNAERLQVKSAAIGESATVSTGTKMMTASQSQGSSNMAVSSYPASSFNTQYSMTPVQYITKPVTTQVRYSIVPATYRSASGAQIGPAVTSQALTGMKPMIPMMLNLPKGKQGLVTRGKYSYTGPDGKTVTTNWYVDETGFHVEDGAPETS